MPKSWTLIIEGTGDDYTQVQTLAQNFVEQLRHNGFDVTYARQSVGTNPSKDILKTPVGSGSGIR